MIVHGPGREPVTDDELKRRLMLLLEDDLGDSPWMVMGTLQYAAASDLFQSLRHYARRHQRPWLVAGMTPILYRWPDFPRKRQLSPDLFVAFAPDRPRASFDVDVEGEFPAFVLEVVSLSSAERDLTEKRLAYGELGAREYAVFTPSTDGPSELIGYRRSEAGAFEPWPADDQGRLWCDVLRLFLVAQGTTIRAATRGGELLPTLSEAEQEIENLRREIEQLKRRANDD